ncbi:hypothetical protein MMC25_000224 [Agyrium rufum]|nr:hypothetical protein [Agyrium rufum]
MSSPRGVHSLCSITTFFYVFSLFLTFFTSDVSALAATDTITWGGDNTRAGYQANHNMDPVVVGSAQFGQLFKTTLPGNYQNMAPEQVFSQPLVYTTSGDGKQYVFVATSQNNIYKLDAKTGVIVLSKNLHIPFLTSDLDGCVDINPLIGVTATGVIDPDTDTWYLTSKTYIDQNPAGAKGRPNGRYYFHAINVNDFSEQPNFPVNLEGTVARNNPIRSFNGGIHHQRPALLHTGNFIYAGFASHCVQYNFTGWIMGWDKTTGQPVEHWATEGAGVPNTVPGGGVWMSGGGLATDGAGSMFFATGNGYASQLNGVPVSGRSPPTSLEEAAVHMTINDDGSLTIVDFFMPWEKVQLDGADKDLGTSPLELLPSQFACGDIQRIGVVTGKSGKTYWINLDNMGGYQNGPNKLDAVIEVFQNENSVYAGAGVYPLEGGYIYINVIQYKTHVFKFSCTNGVPAFTHVADSPEVNAYILGVGHGTVTSLNNQPGTGLVWTSDVEGSNLRIYNAIPVNGVMTEINSFVVPGTTKFTRPVFGDGIVYMGTTQGYFYGFGSPVNLPLNCTQQAFGSVNLKATSPAQTITCKAGIDVQVTGVGLSGNPNFAITPPANLPLSVPAGSSFSFSATFTPGTVGPLSSSALVNTTNSVGGYSISTPVKLSGTGQSQAALLNINPNTVSYDGVITGQVVGGTNSSIIILNAGNAVLTVTQFQYSTQSETGPWITANISADGNPSVGPFTFYGLPSSIPANSQTTVNINFNPTYSANFAAFVNVVTNGGTRVFDVVGTAGTYPNALLEFQTIDGSGWVEYDNTTAFTFGNVNENSIRSLKMRLTNNGSTSAAKLSVTVSKPPFGVPGIIGAVNQIDLAEGTSLGPGESATATLFCAVPKSQVNVPAYNGSAGWTLNTGDPNFGKQHIDFICEAVAPQAGPLFPNGTAIYNYTGCAIENNPGRQLKTQLYVSTNNTNEMCITACSQAGYIFSGSQYQTECWCGNVSPRQLTTDGDCNYACAGDGDEICGGNGINGDLGAYISLFADSTRFDGDITAPVGPFVNPGTAGFTSLGCYTEGSAGRALPNQQGVPAETVANCLKACAGFGYAGVEYGGECYCGNALGTGSIPAPATDCGMPCNDNQTEWCGGPNRLNMYQASGSAQSSTTSLLSSATSTVTGSVVSSATPTSTSSVPATIPTGVPAHVGPWSYVNCYVDSQVARTLPDAFYAGYDMTLEHCAGNCTGYNFFGTEYTQECYCAMAIAPAATIATDGRCNMPCGGNSTETCGGPNGLTLFNYTGATTTTSSSSVVLSTTSSLSSATSTLTSGVSSVASTTTSSTTSTTTTSSAVTIPTGIPAHVGPWSYVNCYVDSQVARTLPDVFYAGYDMTIEHCAGNCTGYNYFGTEYSQECYCAMAIIPSATIATDGRCNMVCGGNSTETCGGPNGLTLYNHTGIVTTTTSSSIVLSTTSTSSSATSSTVVSSTTSVSTVITSSSASSSSSAAPSTTSTVSSSSTSSAASSTTSTVISSTISSTASSSAATSTAVSSTSTSSPTSSSTSTSTVSSSTTSPATTSSTVLSTSTTSTISTTSTTSSTTSSTKPTSTTPVIPKSVGVFTYIDCHTEIPGRALTGKAIASDDMTIERCASNCTSFTYFAVEYGRECYCGNSLPSTSVTATDGRCNMVCGGNSTEICGGPNGLTLYENVPNPWQYIGCANETNPRALPLATSVSPGMTIETCQSYCLSQNLPLAGLEYADECHCGTALQSNSTLGFTGCNMPCAGNSSEMCGGSSRLSVYNYTLYTPPQLVSKAGNFSLQGCFSEPAGGRALGAYTFTNTTNMTTEICVEGCQVKGYSFAGLEYGQECWCANALNSASAQVANSQCNKLCSGTSTEYCGAANLIAVYENTMQVKAAIAVVTSSSLTSSVKTTSTTSATVKASSTPAISSASVVTSSSTSATSSVATPANHRMR